MRAPWRRTSEEPSQPSEPPAPSRPVYPTRRPREDGESFRTAALTFVRNEKVFLPRWLDHYGREFGVENLYVIDDNSDDGSTDDLACDVIRIPPVRGGRFESTRMGFLAGHSRALLTLYDAVVFADADEFLVADPAAYGSLREFVEAQPQEVLAVGALGFNVVQARDEGPLDPQRPVLSQRKLASFVPVMCKPALKYVPAPWYGASHGIRLPYRVDPALWMFHMKFADRDVLGDMAAHRQAMVAADGRSRVTSWRRGPDEMVSVLDDITAGVESSKLPEFVPPSGVDLAALSVEDEGGRWRAPRGSQVEMMGDRPLVRIPERFYDTV